MTKFYCDTCESEIKQGEMTAEFRSLERTGMFTGKKPDAPQTQMSNYILCESCAKEIKREIAALIVGKGKKK